MVHVTETRPPVATDFGSHAYPYGGRSFRDGRVDNAGPGRSGFAGMLRSLRLQASLSQHRLARMSAVSVRAIRDLELGKVRNPRRATVSLLADALGLTGAQRVGFEQAAYASAANSQP